MSQVWSILPLFFTLILCVANVYAMNVSCVSVKKPVRLFVLMTVFCFCCNAFLFLKVGRESFNKIMVLTIAVPYFILFLWVTKDKLAQTFFNFWLWVTIYAFFSNLSMFINDITFGNLFFLNALRLSMLSVYLLVFCKVIMPHYRRIQEVRNINWWVFSLVPLSFEILIVAIHKMATIPEGFSRNYLLLLIVFALMVMVYALIIYTFRKVNIIARSEYEKLIYSQQLDAAKVQIKVLSETQTQTAMYRHDMRHNLTAIDAYLAVNHVQQARDYIQEVQGGLEELKLETFCENSLVNLLCSYFADKAASQGVQMEINVVFPEQLSISDMELCTVLSNGLENALRAVGEMKSSDKWIRFQSRVRQSNLLFEIKNPYEGEVLIRDGMPVSKGEGNGIGCKSIQSVIQAYKGHCLFEADKGVFALRVVLPLNNIV